MPFADLYGPSDADGHIDDRPRPEVPPRAAPWTLGALSRTPMLAAAAVLLAAVVAMIAVAGSTGGTSNVARGITDEQTTPAGQDGQWRAVAPSGEAFGFAGPPPLAPDPGPATAASTISPPPPAADTSSSQTTNTSARTSSTAASTATATSQNRPQRAPRGRTVRPPAGTSSPERTPPSARPQHEGDDSPDDHIERPSEEPTAPAPRSPRTSTAPCAAATLIAVRGDGPSATSTARGRQLVLAARNRFPTLHGPVEATDAADTRRQFTTVARACPSTRFLLLGVGEGARPAATVLASIRSEQDPIPLSRLIAVAIAVEPVTAADTVPRTTSSSPSTSGTTTPTTTSAGAPPDGASTSDRAPPRCLRRQRATDRGVTPNRPTPITTTSAPRQPTSPRDTECSTTTSTAGR